MKAWDSDNCGRRRSIMVANGDILTRTCYRDDVLNAGRYVLQSTGDARHHDQLRVHGHQQGNTVHRVSTRPILQCRYRNNGCPADFCCGMYDIP